jgi:fatty-acyl-CoA synthase
MFRWFDGSPQLPKLEWIIRMGEGRTPDMLNYTDVLAKGHGGIVREEPLDCHDPIDIQFTSGTTGSPKGAILAHHNMMNNARFIAQGLNFSEVDQAMSAIG